MTPFLQHLVKRHEPAAPPTVRPRLPGRFESVPGLPEAMPKSAVPDLETRDGFSEASPRMHESSLTSQQSPGDYSSFPGREGRSSSDNFQERMSDTPRKGIFAGAPPTSSRDDVKTGSDSILPVVAEGRREKREEGGTPDAGRRADLRPAKVYEPEVPDGRPGLGDSQLPEDRTPLTESLLMPPLSEAAAFQELAERWFRQRQPQAGQQDAESRRIRPWQAAAGRRMPAAPGAEPAPTIKVTIGRIEVKTATNPVAPEARKSAPPRKPRLSLDDYLKTKKGPA